MINEQELTDAFEFLDELRESGETNMFGAAPYLQSETGWDKYKSKKVVTLWMTTFSDNLPEARASEAVKLL